MPVPVDPTRVTRVVLANGLTAIAYHNPAAPVVAINTYVKAGYFDETDDVVGIAHVLEHMYFKGTERFGVGEIARATKAAGGYLNAYTIYDHTSYYAVLPSSGFAEGLAVQADAYARSRVDADELARELEVIIQEVKRKADNPGAVAVESLYALLFDRHRMRRWRIGTEDGLRRLDRDDVLRFYRNFYTPSNTILVVAGDVDPDAAIALVEREYGSIPAATPVRDEGPAEPDHTGFRYRAIAGDVTQTTLEIGWRTVPLLHPDAPALDLAAGVLGAGRSSPLYRAVRDGRLARVAGASHFTPASAGVFSVWCEGEPATAAAAAGTMWHEVAMLTGRGAVSAADVTRAQRLAAARLARRLEGVEGQAAYLAEWEAAGGWSLGADFHDRFMASGPADVRDVAARYLAGDRAAMIEYHPASRAPIADDASGALRALGATPAAGLDPVPEVAVPAIVSGARVELERVEGGVHAYRTSAGMPVLIRQRAGAPVAYMGILAGVGAADESRAHAGITLLAARACARQTVSRGALEIASACELLGGSISASAGAETFGWSISVPSGGDDAALALLADVAQHAALPDEVIETERAALLADAAAARDDMYRYPLRLLQYAAFDGHPYATPAGGDEASLVAITPPMVRAWYDETMRRAPFIAVVASDRDPGITAAAVAAVLGDLTGGVREARQRHAWPEAVRVRSEERAKAQTALAIGFPGPSRTGEARYVARVLTTIASGLGGRFFEALRDRRSLAYTVHAFNTEMRAAGMFVGYIATSPGSEDAVREGLLEEFARIAESGVTDDELARAKRYILGMHDIRQERGGAVLADIADAWLVGTGLAELETFRAGIERVTPDDVQRLASARFVPSRRAEGVVRGVLPPGR